jgi:hypothetical protein
LATDFSADTSLLQEIIHFADAKRPWDDQERAEIALAGMVGRRLKYRSTRGGTATEADGPEAATLGDWQIV